MTKKINTTFEKEIYKKYYTLVSLTCSRRLIQKDLIDDAVQSTFLLYIKEQDKIKSNLSTWFYWASKNVCIVMNRKVKENVELSENLIEYQEVENDICLDKLITSLPKKKSELLLMKFFDNLSYGEIADITHSKEETVKKAINRTISSLQSKFKKKDVFITALLAQLFHSGKVSSATINSSSFILQNSLIQQSILKEVSKMILISKLKILIPIIMFLSIASSGFVIAKNIKDDIKLKNGKYIFYMDKFSSAEYEGFLVKDGKYFLIDPNYLNPTPKEVKIVFDKREVSFMHYDVKFKGKILKKSIIKGTVIFDFGKGKETHKWTIRPYSYFKKIKLIQDPFKK
ncbi:MAG: hypothetical protein COA79_06785 [Planctomycetota bacterium]|nr:MAG: hypothetical protein COA79_06785 [Planctomycetota bacterium]